MNIVNLKSLFSLLLPLGILIALGCKSDNISAGNVMTTGQAVYVISEEAFEGSGNHKYSMISVVAPDETFIACLVKLQEDGIEILQAQTNASFLFLFESGFDPFTIPSICEGEDFKFSFLPGAISKSETEFNDLYFDYDYLYLPTEIRDDLSNGTPYFLVASSNDPGSPALRLLPPFEAYVTHPPLSVLEFVFHIGLVVDEINAHHDLAFELIKQTAPGTFESVPMTLVDAPADRPAYVFNVDTNVTYFSKGQDELPYQDCLPNNLNTFWQESIEVRGDPSNWLFLLAPGIGPNTEVFTCNWNYPGFEMQVTFPMVAGNLSVRSIPSVPLEVSASTGEINIDPAFKAGVSSWNNYFMIVAFDLPTMPPTQTNVFAAQGFDINTFERNGNFYIGYFISLGLTDLQNLYLLKYETHNSVELIPTQFVMVP